MTKRIAAFWLLLCLALSARAGSLINLDVGELKILTPGAVERVAVGNAGIVSTSLLSTGQLLVFAESEGLTSLHLWLVDGREMDYRVQVDAVDFNAARLTDNLDKKRREVKELLYDVQGLDIRTVGDRVVLTGVYDGHSELVDRIKQVYPEILDLTLSGKLYEVQELVRTIPGATAKLVGTRIVLTGTVDESYEAHIGTIQGVYEEVMDLTRKENTELTSEKMVLMHITITEFNKSFTENLGIDWNTSIAGPGGAIGAELRTSTVSIVDADNTPGVFGSAANFATPLGFFGIATEIASRIDFAVDTGNAVVLAQPRLAARSGGEASFTVGGEIPIPVVTQTTTDVEFKEFGILLEISPEVDAENNILATVVTEISSVDPGNSVNGVPGFATRRTSADISLRSGQTLVMSGLLDEQTSETVSKIKGLGDIPILGELFKSTRFMEERTELIIFVTPIVYDAGSPENLSAVKRQKELVQEFNQAVTRSNLEIVD